MQLQLSNREVLNSLRHVSFASLSCPRAKSRWVACESAFLCRSLLTRPLKEAEASGRPDERRRIARTTVGSAHIHLPFFLFVLSRPPAFACRLSAGSPLVATESEFRLSQPRVDPAAAPPARQVCDRHDCSLIVRPLIHSAAVVDFELALALSRLSPWCRQLLVRRRSPCHFGSASSIGMTGSCATPVLGPIGIPSVEHAFGWSTTRTRPSHWRISDSGAPEPTEQKSSTCLYSSCTLAAEVESPLGRSRIALRSSSPGSNASNWSKRRARAEAPMCGRHEDRSAASTTAGVSVRVSTIHTPILVHCRSCVSGASTF